MSASRIFVVIPAAGHGSRMNSGVAKQYLEFEGHSVLHWSVAAFLALPAIAHVLVVTAPDDERAGDALAGLSGAPGGTRLRVAAIGGATRRDSVLAGLECLARAPYLAREQDRVIVHDAARPGLRTSDVERLIAEVGDDPAGGLLALPVDDTVKRSSDGEPRRVLETLPRDRLWHAQTPQLFRFAALRAALHASPGVTDEAQAIERAGGSPRLVTGSPRNLKITRAGDLELLRALWHTAPTTQTR